MTILGAYVAIGLVVAIQTWIRSRKHPLLLIDNERPLLSALITVPLWPIVLPEQRAWTRRLRRLREQGVRTDWVMKEVEVPSAWIKTKLLSDPAEFDRQASGCNPADNPGVRELLDMMIPGDELWEFSSNDDSWRNLAGRAGYVIFRDVRQVAHLTTLMN